MSAISSRRLLDDGDAAITGSHGLATARHIIHAASAAGDAGTVARSIQNVLRLSIERKFGNVATPALGTGTGGMEMATFARLLATELRRHCESGAEFPKLLRLVAYRNRDAETVTATLRDLGVSPL
jgi:O-acetyl-ADP-ribose deacetylase (regulator of RNase III)